MNNNNALHFPKDFIWGVSSSSYQIEGAVDEDGRGESIWDRFSHTPGKVARGENGDVACDHYHRWRDDVALMVDLGIKAYRFSIAWPRILPDGTGSVNEKGLDFYSRLVDHLLENNITPYVNFYHWDLPQKLEDNGGWRSRETSKAYMKYVGVVVKRLSDRVKHWMTLNEPICSSYLGYMHGIHAPGAKEPMKVVNAVVHNLMLAHGLGIQTIKSITGNTSKVGIAHNPYVATPLSDDPAHIAEADKFWHLINDWWYYPFFKGKYPEDLLEMMGEAAPEVKDGDMKIISSPMDYFGLNIYHGDEVKSYHVNEKQWYFTTHPNNYPRTTMDWTIKPDCMHRALTYMHEHYDMPEIMVTENGCSFNDVVDDDGKVHDTDRVNYLDGHISSVKKAMDEGVKVTGYFVWSLLDNFEWALGYSKRFGITYVDYETQQRIPKDSFYWYKKLITS